MTDFVLLVLRLTIGTLMAGHGAQKLFGWFKGPGLKGTHGFMEQLGMAPGQIWGSMAAFGEFSGGVMTALGFLNPMGPQNIMSAMAVATRRVHWKTPVWVSAGGAELTATNFAIALTLAILGPGRFSLDRAFGIRMPKWLVALTWANHIAVTGAALFKPEVAGSLVEKVSPVASVTTPASESTTSSVPSDLEVETRSINVPSEESVPAGHA